MAFFSFCLLREVQPTGECAIWCVYAAIAFRVVPRQIRSTGVFSDPERISTLFAARQCATNPRASLGSRK